jgi:PilZ domain
MSEKSERMGMQKTRDPRVRFDMGYPARIVAIDGTWFRDCYMEDVSQTGAKVTVTGTLEGLNLSEFFLALSPTGNAYRKCQMVWLKGETIGVRFASAKPTTSSRPRRGVQAPNAE